METKVQKFRKNITEKPNRKILNNHFGRATVNGWIYTGRVPMERNAKIISALLGVPLSEVPYYRVEHVI
jgi:hypothetical protein